MNRFFIYQLAPFVLLNLQFSVCDDLFAYAQDSTKARKTLPVYEEADNMNKYFWTPSGWMPDGNGISFRENFEEKPHSGNTCIKLGYDSNENGWVGIYWLADGSWEGPGVDIYEKLKVGKADSIKLTFWARGERGGETVQFSVGGVSKGSDSINPSVKTAWIRLEQNWRQYEIDLSGKDLSNVVGGFCWVTNRSQNRGRNEIWFFLDDIIYEVK
jgi:hypothetical protein